MKLRGSGGSLSLTLINRLIKVIDRSTWTSITSQQKADSDSKLAVKVEINPNIDPNEINQNPEDSLHPKPRV